MAEATLSLNFEDFKRHVARHLGFPTAESAQSAEQQTIIAECVQGGYRLALYNNPRGYQWSFLQQHRSITTWASIAVAAGTTVSSSQQGTPPLTRLANSGGGVFEPTMRGRTIALTGVGSFTILNTGNTGDELPGQSTFCYIQAGVVAAGVTWSIASTGDFRLPDSFGGMRGPLTFAAADNAWVEVPIVSESEIRRLRQRPAVAAGEPRLAAITPDPTPGYFNNAPVGQRFTLMLWPTPDAAYTLTYQDALLRDQLSSSNRYPLGGSAHCEMFEAAMLAYAEQRIDDDKGVRWAEFVEKLDASIRLDRKQFGAERLGYNGDRSDMAWGRGGPPWRRDNYSNTVTVNGVTPE